MIGLVVPDRGHLVAVIVVLVVVPVIVVLVGVVARAQFRFLGGVLCLLGRAERNEDALHDLELLDGAAGLAGALERREPWGVWGGQLLLNGKVLQGKRRRGRPPKDARPEDQLPEIPIPAHLQDRVVYKTA